MKFTVEGCRHLRCEPYGTPPDHNAPRFTCLVCHHRLRTILNREGNLQLVDDFPPGPCEHPRKQSIRVPSTGKAGYMRAMCPDCGRVLRHPDGPGAWEEVLFYGFVIHEEKW